MTWQNLLLELQAVPLPTLIAAVGAALFIVLLVIVAMLLRQAGARRLAAETETLRAVEFEGRLGELMRANNELSGRLQTVAELSVTRQSELSRAINERLDKVTHRLGENLTASSQRTSESLSKLNERLALIDSAQKNITELSSQVVSLQEILANKQQRGAFGQGRMEAIVQDALPGTSFSFQATLSNNNRPDCVIRLPNTPEQIVIDAKFPLESVRAFQEARTPEEHKQAAQRLRNDIGVHIRHIRERYFIPGETQDTAIMFVPSESIYADLHEHFDDLIQKAYRARVVIVSPSMLVLAIQVMQSILKDARMREQAHLIQGEVIRLMDDVGRLRDRVLDLQKHFGQANQDIDKILVSSEKIARRGRAIEALELDEDGKLVDGGERQLLAGE